MRARRSPGAPRRWPRDWVFGVVGAGAAFLLYQLVATVIEELPRLIEGLK